jgi:Uma2 family endonuclease
MSALAKQRMTVEEYLALERETGVRHEYYYGEVFAMVGASENHILITGSMYSNLYVQLRGRDCRIYQTDMKLRINKHIYTYPDIAAVCGERQFEDEARTILLNPTVIIEVLSPSTEMHDRTNKLQYYHSVKSVQEYILISQEKPHAEHFVRQPDDKWLLTFRDGVDALIELKSINCILALRDVYEQIEFEPEDD